MFLSFVGLTALLVGGVGVANAVRAWLDGKISTIATLKCIGAPRALVFRIYLLQVLSLATIGILAGLVLGAALPMVASDLLAQVVPIRISSGLFLEPLIVAAVFGLLTALTFSVWAIARAGDIPAGSLFRSLVSPTKGWPTRALYYAHSSARRRAGRIGNCHGVRRLFRDLVRDRIAGRHDHLPTGGSRDYKGCCTTERHSPAGFAAGRRWPAPPPAPRRRQWCFLSALACRCW